VHVLVIPKQHIACADDVNAENSVYVQKIFEKVPEIAKTLGLTNGYRIISNCGDDACQSVKHLHFHILGGKNICYITYCIATTRLYKILGIKKQYHLCPLRGANKCHKQ
jgi:diadenosine tetraphosphate (Ap4A) HIT family hydrolase